MWNTKVKKSGSQFENIYLLLSLVNKIKTFLLIIYHWTKSPPLANICDYFSIDWWFCIKKILLILMRHDFICQSVYFLVILGRFESNYSSFQCNYLIQSCGNPFAKCWKDLPIRLPEGLYLVHCYIEYFKNRVMPKISVVSNFRWNSLLAIFKCRILKN